jgi:hypothetical protein
VPPVVPGPGGCVRSEDRPFAACHQTWLERLKLWRHAYKTKILNPGEGDDEAVPVIERQACTLCLPRKSSQIWSQQVDTSRFLPCLIVKSWRGNEHGRGQAWLIKPTDSAYSCSAAPRSPAPGKGLGESVNLIVVATGKSE